MKDKEMLAYKILDSYVDKFGELPPMPMMRCMNEKDPQYLKMCMNALKTGKEVTIEDLNKYFPMDKDKIY